MNPQTQNRLAALAVGAATLAYLGVKKPWKKTGPKTEDVPESKLPDHGKIKKGIKKKFSLTIGYEEICSLCHL